MENIIAIPHKALGMAFLLVKTINKERNTMTLNEDPLVITGMGKIVLLLTAGAFAYTIGEWQSMREAEATKGIQHSIEDTRKALAALPKVQLVVLWAICIVYGLFAMGLCFR